jgi:hypothetical protein
MSAVKSRPLEELLELVSLGSLNDLLERYKVGGDSPEFTVEQINAARIARDIPYVDGKYSQVHEHPSVVG